MSLFLAYLALLFCIVSLLTYLVPVFFTVIIPKQNLRKKYGEWALVTGASSGIGRSLCEQLAAQGLSLLMVALPDKHLSSLQLNLSERFAAQKFVAIGVDLGTFNHPAASAAVPASPTASARPLDTSVSALNLSPLSPPIARGGPSGESALDNNYMSAIENAIRTNVPADQSVNLVFNNAGFVELKGFESSTIDHHMRMMECNVLSQIRIAHHFYSKMVQEQKKGAIVFTASATGILPCPLSAMYSATKAFIAQFASSLAIEAKDHGIDILSVNPGYTRTNLFKASPALRVLQMMEAIGDEPSTVADRILRSIGRVSVRDIGLYTFIARMLSRAIDTNAMVAIIDRFSNAESQYKKTLAAKK